MRTLLLPLLNPSRSEICSFCFRPPFDWPISMLTLASGIPEIFDSSISQVSLNWANTSTLDSGFDESVRLTSDMTRETLGCSTFVASRMVLTAAYSCLSTMARAARPPLSWAASASNLSR